MPRRGPDLGYGRQYARHTLFTVSATVGSGILFYLLRIILYTHLPTDDYGRFYVLLSAALIVLPILRFGFEPGLVPFVTQYREKNDCVAIKSIVSGALAIQGLLALVGIAVVWALAEPIAVRWLHAPHAVNAVRLVALHAGLSLAFTTGMAFLLGMQSIGARSLCDFVRVVVCVSAAWLLLHAGWGIEAAAAGYAAGVTAGALAITGAAWIFHRSVVAASLAWRPALLRTVFHSGKYLTIAYGGVMIFSQMDTVMIGFLMPGFTAAAAYQLAVPTVTILYSVLLALGVSFMPMVATLVHRGERDLLADGVSRFFEAAAVVLLPATVVMACFSDVLMTLLFRRDILNAPDAFNILAVGSVFYFFCYFTLQILAGMGRTRAACIAVSVSLGLNLLLNIVLIRFFGIRGAATATVLSHVAATVLGLRYVRRDLAVAFRWKTALATVTVCALLAAIGHGVRGTALFDHHPIVTAGTVGAVMYGTALFALEALGFARLRQLARVTMGRNRPE
ncbi:MAG: oligosaccharide flippase family protein [bacterium]|nr:oligosaccharide flippase family protein [bacterium]